MRLDAWLAQAPPTEEIDQEIAELERKLALLRVVKQTVSGQTTPQGNGNGSNGHGQAALIDLTQQTFDPGRISTERRQILDAMLACPGANAGPTLVEKKLKARGIDMGVKPIQTNMGRMVKIGLIQKVRQGRYHVPRHVAEYLKAGGSMN
jgi:hypothetical protein